MKNLIIDTDVGTDVDDLFALAYALKNPGIKVKAVSTVHGDTEIRAKIVKKLEKILDKNIPIIAGAKKPLKMTKESKEKGWCGFEHLALTQKEINEPFYNSKEPRYNKNTIVACIGPLTNIALQLKYIPDIKNIQEIYLMGNHNGSHNFAVDTKATNIVTSHKWKKFFVTKEISERIYFTKEELKLFKGTELGDFLYESAMRWLNHNGRDKSVMYDVLAVSAAAGEDFVKFKEQDSNFVSYGVDSRLKDKILETILNKK